MRRALSSLLILFFGLGPLAVTLSDGDESRLPFCCRRHGDHHKGRQRHPLKGPRHHRKVRIDGAEQLRQFSTSAQTPQAYQNTKWS